MADILHDEEFGAVRIRRNALAKYVRLRIKHDGSLSVTLPKRAALRYAKKLVDDSRVSIRASLQKKLPAQRWTDADNKLLRKRAAAYFPRRLSWLAEQHGFTYRTIRFSSAETRWGSCSSSGTISLNIWLMTLPLELIDYVLVHELSHTRHMNHGKDFWTTVERCMADYKLQRRRLKQYNPHP